MKELTVYSLTVSEKEIRYFPLNTTVRYHEKLTQKKILLLDVLPTEIRQKMIFFVSLANSSKFRSMPS